MFDLPGSVSGVAGGSGKGSDDVLVVILQALYREVRVLLISLDTLGAGLCSRHRGDVRNSVADRFFSDIAVVMRGCLSGRCIDDQLDLAVGDLVGDVRAAFVEFINALCIDAGFLDHLVGLACREDMETKLVKCLGDVDELILIAVAYG